LAVKYGFTYTRYADDMTFSSSGNHQEKIPKLLANVRRIIKDEGFTIHPDKLRIMRKGVRKEVTGIVVNEKLNISRKTLDKFKTLLFQIEKDGLEGKSWNGSDNLLAAIGGYANFIQMVNPTKGAILMPRVKTILKKYEFKHEIKYPKKVEPNEADSKVIDKKVKKPWWKFW